MFIIIFWFRIIILKLFCTLVCTDFASFSYRAIGGHDADKDSWKFIVAIACGHVVHCGGTLIRPTWIVTAAHCVKGDNIDLHIERFGELNVRLGSKDLNYVDIKLAILPGKTTEVNTKVSTISQRDSVKIIKFIVHPNYYLRKISKKDNAFMDVVSNDMALIKLDKENKNNECVKLPTKPIYKSKFCKTAGWGSKSVNPRKRKNIGSIKNVLQELTLNVLSSDVCKDLLTRVSYQNSATEEETNQQKLFKICCQTFGANASVYSGDSGCPLICDGELQGIANLAVQQYPSREKIVYTSIFTAVPHYIDWIDSVLVDEGEESLSKDLYRGKGSALINSMYIIFFCTTVNILL